MARAPRASVALTSGQGVGRLSYQKGRALSGLNSPSLPRVKSSFIGTSMPATPSLNRDYGKGTSTPVGSSSFGDVGDTSALPTGLSDIAGQDPLRKPRGPMKGPKLTPMKAPKLK
jgi:hypothetical protein